MVAKKPGPHTPIKIFRSTPHPQPRVQNSSCRIVWNLTGSSCYPSNFKEMRWFKLPISRLRDFTRSHNKMSCRMLKRGRPGPQFQYPIRRLIVRSREVSKPRDWYIIVRSLWNLTDTWAALLPMCLSNLKAMRLFKLSISRLRDFTRSYNKTSYRILKRGPKHCLSRQD